jgi:phosphoribosylformylglycinamidine cyclo-ligase
MIDGSTIKAGDAIIGIASSGMHSNGFSLTRKVFFDHKKYTVHTKIDELGMTLGEALLVPTRIYCKQILSLIESGTSIKGLVHITGGGFYENIPRILPENTAARIQRTSFEIPAIFKIIQKEGKVEDREMFTTFNMGIGMMIVLAAGIADRAVEQLKKSGESPHIIGSITGGTGERVIID